MAEAAFELDERPTPRIIKVSTKRQVTIPADMHAASGFTEYAFATWNDDGSITIAPIDVRNEDNSVAILRSLLAQGFNGEQLIDEYEKIIHPVIDYRAEVERGLKDIEEGRARPFAEMQQRLKEKYGL